MVIFILELQPQRYPGPGKMAAKVYIFLGINGYF